MARRPIDYDVLVADSVSQLDKLVQEKIHDGWELHGRPRTKIENHIVTGRKKLIYWREVTKYDQTTG